jgi:hypothetical protein
MWIFYPTVQRTSGHGSMENAIQSNIAKQLFQPYSVVTAEAYRVKSHINIAKSGHI